MLLLLLLVVETAELPSDPLSPSSARSQSRNERCRSSYHLHTCTSGRGSNGSDEDKEASENFWVVSEAAGGCGRGERLEFPMGPAAGLEG